MDGDVIGVPYVVSIGLNVADDVCRVRTCVTDPGVGAIVGATAASGRSCRVGYTQVGRVSTGVGGIACAGATTGRVVINAGIAGFSFLTGIVVQVDVVVVTDPVNCTRV